jgi:hypothetical protein
MCEKTSVQAPAPHSHTHTHIKKPSVFDSDMVAHVSGTWESEIGVLGQLRPKTLARLHLNQQVSSGGPSYVGGIGGRIGPSQALSKSGRPYENNN